MKARKPAASGTKKAGSGPFTAFIQRNGHKIIDEWIVFAGTLLPWAEGMAEKELRDHAEELLVAVVADMSAPQSSGQQAEKSKGRAVEGALAKVGHKHAAQRLGTGFNLDQLVSEYRALRASILRLWAESQGDKDDEVTRFNEAIDESLVEATIRYSEMLDHTREQFLAILGHDLRNPLGAIMMGATILTRSETIDDKQVRIAARVLNSANRMNRLVDDLLDLTRTRLGDGIPIVRARMDLADVCEQVIAELGVVHPDCPLRFEREGDLVGEWDSDRITQVVSNLVANALEHGAAKTPVRIVARAEGSDVLIQVHNEGAVVSASVLKKIFEPMVRQATEGADRNPTGMGLGLYIARAVVTAHGGTIEATSSKTGGTTFTVEIPRKPPPKRSKGAEGSETKDGPARKAPGKASKPPKRSGSPRPRA